MITELELKAFGQEEKGRRISDGGSLFGTVRIARDGRVVVFFEYRYKCEGRQRAIGCGTWPATTMAAIRKQRDIYKGEILQGRDPLADTEAKKLEAAAAQAEAKAAAQARIAAVVTAQARITVADLFERWAAVVLISHKDGGKEIRRMFAKDVLPLIGSLAVEDLRKGHITAVTDALLARGVTRMAKMIFSLIRQMLGFAVDRDIIEADPSASIRKKNIGGKDTERDRVLSEPEIRGLRDQMPAAGLLVTTEAAIWLALGTACRIGELLRAEWRHINFERREWLIPAEHSKSGRPHTVYLSDFALRHFGTLHGINCASVWCFPNADNSAGVCTKTATKQIGDRQRGDASPMSRRSRNANALALPGGKWTPHDLRRTAATMMVRLGVLPEVAERCLNHIEESRVKRTYQRHSYESEMRAAWRILGERLELLMLEGSNVVTLEKRA